LMGRSVGNSTVAIEQRMGIQIWWCGFNQIRVIYPRYNQGVRNPVWSWDRRGHYFLHPLYLTQLEKCQEMISLSFTV
jgi:hypothetical protein